MAGSGAGSTYQYRPAGSYDLSALSNWKYRHERTVRYLSWFTFAVTLAGAAEGVEFARTTGGLSGSGTALWLFALLVPVLSFGLGWWTLRRSATALTLDGDGIRLSYPGGRSSSISLSSPRFRLQIYELTRPGASLAHAPYRHQIRSQGIRWDPISSEAFEAVLRLARRLQLSVRVHPVAHEWVGVAYTRYTLGPRSGAVPESVSRSPSAEPPAATGFRDRRP